MKDFWGFFLPSLAANFQSGTKRFHVINFDVMLRKPSFDSKPTVFRKMYASAVLVGHLVRTQDFPRN